MQLTKAQIIKETVEFYSNNPRAIDPTSHMCYYETHDGRRCAVGRCMTPEARERYKDKELSIWDIFQRDRDNFDSLFQPQYRGHFIGFWETIQCLHDQSNNWRQFKDRLELSDFGQKYRESMLDAFGR